MSLKKHAKKNNVKIISIKEAEKIAKYYFSLQSDKIIDLKKFKTKNLYNMHFSLSKYRGTYTSIWPILFGDKVGGVILHKIEKTIDTGKIIAKKNFSIAENTRAQNLYQEYTNCACKLFSKNINLILNKKIKNKFFKRQNSTYFSRNSINFKRNSQLDLELDYEEIKKQLYAYTFRKSQILKIKKNKIVEIELIKKSSNIAPNRVIKKTSSYIDISINEAVIRCYFDKFKEAVMYCKKGNLNKLKKIIKNIAGINDCEIHGNTLLMVSVIFNHYKIFNYLLKLGAEINIYDSQGITLMRHAAKNALKKKN